MTHLVRTTLTKRGTASKRPGPWHLSEHGPVTLCGDDLDLATVHRLDLTRPRLLGPDVCVECVGIFDPDAVAEAQRQADRRQETSDKLLAALTPGDPLNESLRSELGGPNESRPAADTGHTDA